MRALIYELRTYVPVPGKEEALHRRFAEHTLHIFARCGVENLGYWTDPDGNLVYLVRFPDAAAQERAWAAFKDDAEWRRVKAATEADGPLTREMRSVTLVPTPYSPVLK